MPANAVRLINVGTPTAQAVEIASQIDAGDAAAAGNATVTWANVTGKPATFPAAPVAATAGSVGGITRQATIAKAAGSSPTKAEFDAVIDALKAAGVIV